MTPEEQLVRLRELDRWGVRLDARPDAFAPRRRVNPLVATFATIAAVAVIVAVAFSAFGLGVRSAVPALPPVSPVPSASATATPTPTPTPTSTPKPKPTKPSSAATYGPGHFPGGTVTASNPWGLPSIADVEDANFEGPWNNEGLIFGVDTGPRKGAVGQVFSDRDGHPVRYVVAPGDSWSAIATRLGGLYISRINCVRRNPDAMVYPGDVVNLSPYTIASVGSENGSTKSDSPLVVKSCLSQTGVPPQK
jgi:hypothetical protein